MPAKAGSNLGWPGSWPEVKLVWGYARVTQWPTQSKPEDSRWNWLNTGRVWKKSCECVHGTEFHMSLWDVYRYLFFLFVYLIIYLSIYLFIWLLFLYLFIYVFFVYTACMFRCTYMHVTHIWVCMYIFASIYLSICLFIYLSIYRFCIYIQVFISSVCKYVFKYMHI